MPGNSEDNTIRVARKTLKPSKYKWFLLISATCASAITYLIAVWFYLQPALIPIDMESEAQIDSSQPCTVKVSFFAAAPAIIIIDFPSLSAQGGTLNRVAALIEKAHLPRNRVLNDAELAQAILASGETPESYYYGHDYQAMDLRRFFMLASQDNIKLNSNELWLKSLLKQLHWLKTDANGAIITLTGSGGPVTQEMRAVILRHELSHGAFYTNSAYAGYATLFWRSLNPTDRSAFSAFLGREGYDTSNTNLMLNETQAYLIFTRNAKFFNAAAVGMTDAEIDTLRSGFIANMPAFWLQKLANATLPASPALPACGKTGN